MAGIMKSKKRIVITNNKDIYDKLNMLHFTNEVVLKNFKFTKLCKILNNINKYNKILTTENVGDYTIIKKVDTFDVSVYFNKN
jgi:hypothetical protein